MKKGIDYIGVTVSFLCFDSTGRLLMAKRGQNARDEQGRWDNGGGGLEFGETFEEALHREVKEEYCADILKFKFLGVRNTLRVHNETPTHWVSIDFKVLVDPDSVRNGEPHKLDEIGWFSLEKLPSPLHSGTMAFLDKHRDELGFTG